MGDAAIAGPVCWVRGGLRTVPAKARLNPYEMGFVTDGTVTLCVIRGRPDWLVGGLGFSVLGDSEHQQRAWNGKVLSVYSQAIVCSQAIPRAV